MNFKRYDERGKPMADSGDADGEDKDCMYNLYTTSFIT